MAHNLDLITIAAVVNSHRQAIITALEPLLQEDNYVAPENADSVRSLAGHIGSVVAELNVWTEALYSAGYGNVIPTETVTTLDVVSNALSDSISSFLTGGDCSCGSPVCCMAAPLAEDEVEHSSENC